MDKTLRTYACIVIGAIGGYGGYELITWSKLVPSDWAAWVQAIGSISAIVAAFIIPMRQHRMQLQVADDDKVEAKLEKLKTLHEIVVVGYAHIKIAYDAFSGDKQAVENYFTNRHSIADIQDVIDAISQAPMYDVPGRGVFVSLIGLKRTLQMARDVATEYRGMNYWGDSFREAAASRMKPHLDYAIGTIDEISDQMIVLANFLSSNERSRAAFRDIIAKRDRDQIPSAERNSK